MFADIATEFGGQFGPPITIGQPKLSAIVAQQAP